MNDRRLFRELAICCRDMDEVGFRILADLAMERGLDEKLEALLLRMERRVGNFRTWPARMSRHERQYWHLVDVISALRWVEKGHQNSPWVSF